MREANDTRTCPSCEGSGETRFNPSSDRDPQQEDSHPCRTCDGSGVALASVPERGPSLRRNLLNAHRQAASSDELVAQVRDMSDRDLIALLGCVTELAPNSPFDEWVMDIALREYRVRAQDERRAAA